MVPVLSNLNLFVIVWSLEPAEYVLQYWCEFFDFQLGLHVLLMNVTSKATDQLVILPMLKNFGILFLLSNHTTELAFHTKVVVPSLITFLSQP